MLKLMLIAFLGTTPFTYTPSWTSTPPNDLVEGQGAIEVNAEVSSFENILPNTPIQANVMVTHPSTSPVDENSFRLGDRPIKVTLVQNVEISSGSNIVLSIYKFMIPGMSVGPHTLPAITVKVGGKEVESTQLVIDVGQGS